MMKKILIITVMALVLGLATASADEFSKVGTAGAQFLKIGMGARYTALGDAATAIVDDVYGLYWNPAAIANVEQSEIAFTSVDWIAGVSLSHLAFAYALREDFSIGFGMSVLSVGDIEITTEQEPNGTGRTYDANSFALLAGFSKRLTDRFIFGLNMKYVTEQISEENSSGICFDIGTLLYTGFKSLRMGMSISNLGPDLQFDGNELDQPMNPNENDPTADPVQYQYSAESYDLPLIFRVGLAYDLLDNYQNRLTMAIEARDPNDNIGQFSVGGEYSYSEKFLLRGGYKFNYEEEGLTLGGGLRLNPTASTSLVFDYAWADFGKLQSTHRFSIGLKF
jgi:opacity protein-like surface antigen